MGREAYLARLALGRSAFGPPIRDENGGFVLGDQVRDRDDKSYTQDWDDRAHPKNLASVQSGKDYRRAQNEVLEACGIVIRNNAAGKRDVSAQEPSAEEQLEKLKDENNDGFAFKYSDRFGGYLLTWWLESARKRLLVQAELSSLSFTSSTLTSFKAAPLTFLSGGFIPWLIACTARVLRRPDVVEPIECMNYLEVNVSSPPASIWERIATLCEDSLYASIEIPCAFLSILQAVGFPVFSTVWTHAKSALRTSTWPQTLFSVCSQTIGEPRFIMAIGMYFTRDYISHQLGWRSYGLLRQIMTRPDRPTQLSIKAAEEDDLLDDISVIGIGRSLGTYTNRRFYGSSSFWSALPIAFPWLSRLLPKGHNIEEIKDETLRRCAATQGDARNDLSIVQQHRAENIVNNLESLGIDVEEDFYVDIDQWTLGVSLPSDGPTHRLDDLAREVDIYTRADAQQENLMNTTAIIDNTDALTSWHQIPPVPATPPTPDPGIVRATSLSEITPRPVRRPTEIDAPEFDEDMQAFVAETLNKRPRRKRKDKKLYRITRMTVLPVDSFAWHASSILTSIFILPIDILFLRTLVSWYISATGTSQTAFASRIGVWPLSLRDLTLSKLTWSTIKLISLSYGCELLIRGALWQFSSRMAINYGCSNSTSKLWARS